MEWFVIALVILNIIPLRYLKFLGTQNLHRHLSALTLLIAFTQLYMLLVIDLFSFNISGNKSVIKT